MALARVRRCCSRLPRTRLTLLTLTAAFFLVPAAQAAAGTYNINFNGPGTGTVTSSPPGINCSDTGGSTTGTCSAEFGFFVNVELTATGDPGSGLAEWSGNTASGTCNSGAENPCHFLSLFETATITANFESLTSPAVEIEPVDLAGITPGAATLNGHVDPAGNGEITECHFDYVTEEAFQATQYSDLSSGGTVPCEPAAPISSPTDVAAALSGLHAATKYHVRLDAANAQSAATPERTFETPPAVSLSTEPASAVGSASATLNGSVNPKGTELTECEFEWGETEAYGETAPCEAPDAAEVGAGNAPVSVHADIAGLNPEATYHFRLVAANEFGTTQGSDQSFATLTVKPIIDSENSSSIGQTAATLEAQINPNGSDTTCQFEYGETESYGETAACAPADLGAGNSDQAASAEITGLSPNTTYHFRVVATNFFGPREGSDQTFTTSPPNPPTASTEGASAITQVTATLNGTLNGQGSDARWYFRYVEADRYEPGAENPYAAGAIAPDLFTGLFAGDAGVVSTDTPESAQLTGLQPLTTYHYQFVVCNVRVLFGSCSPSSNKALGADRTFTTVPLAPVVKTGLAFGIGPSAATVVGAVNPQGADTTYHVSYVDAADFQASGYSNATNTTETDAGQATSTEPLSVSLSGLAFGTIYHYRFVATNAGGTTFGEDQTVGTYGVAPALATGAAAGVGQTTAKLTGQLDPQGSDTTYRFEYGTTTNYGTITPETDAGSGNSVQSVSAGLSGLKAATTYHFRLVAGSDGGSTQGANHTFTTQPAPAVTPPPGEQPAPLICKKNFVKKHGKCVKKKHHKKHTNKAHPKRHAKRANNNRGGAK